MAKEFKLSVVAPDRTIAEVMAQSLIAPGVLGYIGVMAGHVPLIVALRTGLIEFTDSGNQRHYVATSGGFMDIGGDAVIVLADNAELAKDIDIKAAEAQLEKARAALRGETSEMGSSEATEELELAMARIRAAKLA